MDNHTKTWLDKQPLWHGCDVGIAMIAAFALGFAIGALLFW